jgi:hypothetical protein
MGAGMSYEEKGAWVYIVVFLGTFIAYVAVIVGRATSSATALADVPYRGPLLWSMGISIGLAIIGRILVEFARPSDTYQSDARDKDITRFSEYVGGGVLAVAALVPFALTLLEADYFWIGNSLYAAFALSAIVGAITKLIAYRRGL